MLHPQNPFPPSPGTPWQARKKSKVTKAVASPASAKGGHQAGNQLTNHTPDPGRVLGLPTAPSHPLKLPMGHLRCAQYKPGTPAANASILQWGSSVPEMLRWRLKKAARKQVTSGQSCEHQPRGNGQGGHCRQNEQQYTRHRGVKVH